MRGLAPGTRISIDDRLVGTAGKTALLQVRFLLAGTKSRSRKTDSTRELSCGISNPAN